MATQSPPPADLTSWPATAQERQQVEVCQAVGLHLLRAVAEVCERHGIRFYFNGGTLLGAWRNAGFIPWDDDVDLVMLRSDYERLRQVIGSELPVDMVFSEPGLGDHATAVPRVGYLPSGVNWVERFGMCPPEKQRIALDIFIMDECPRNRVVHRVWLSVTRLVQMMMAIRSTTAGRIWSARAPVVTRMSASALWLVSRSVPRAVQARAIHRLAVAFSGRGTGLLAQLNNARHLRGIRFERDVFGSVTVDFCGIRAGSPDPQRYLGVFYGAGYMTPPNVEERSNHKYRDLWAVLPGSTADH